jgi:hypothetical protein
LRTVEVVCSSSRMKLSNSEPVWKVSVQPFVSRA